MGYFSKTHMQPSVGELFISKKIMTSKYNLQQGFTVHFWNTAYVSKNSSDFHAKNSQEISTSNCSCNLEMLVLVVQIRFKPAISLYSSATVFPIRLNNLSLPEHQAHVCHVECLFLYATVTYHQCQLRLSFHSCINDHVPIYFCKCFGIQAGRMCFVRFSHIMAFPWGLEANSESCDYRKMCREGKRNMIL